MTDPTCHALAPNESTSSNGEKLAWYEEWFDRDEYELVYQARDDRDARVLLGLFERTVSLPPGARILDMACGRGRHALILTQRGFRVAGIDLSSRSIEIARKRARKAGLDVEFRQGDMRAAHFDGEFDAVVNLFTSFGYFADDSDHHRAIYAMAAALKPSGVLFQDFMNADFVRKHLIEEDVRFQGSTEITQQRWIEDGRLRKRIIMEKENERHTFEESVRMFTVEDFQHMYEQAGLRLVESFGDYHGHPPDVSRPRLILVSEKI